jgi:kinesin family protein 6/9
MSGSSQNYKYRGIIPRAITQVFSEIRERFDQAITIRVSYAEIYNEMVNSYIH